MSTYKNEQLEAQVKNYYNMITKYYHKTMVLAFLASIALVILGYLPNHLSAIIFALGIVSSGFIIKKDDKPFKTICVELTTIYAVILCIAYQVPRVSLNLAFLGLCITTLFLVPKLVVSYGVAALIVAGYLRIGQNFVDQSEFIVEANSFLFAIISLTILTSSINKIFKMILIKSQEKEAVLTEKAAKDLMTDLYNKVSTEKLINEKLKEDSKTNHVFLIIDIDNFKSVNDINGHFVGDKVICEVANALKDMVRESDIVGRIGGDEFVVLLSDIKSIVILNAKIEGLRNQLSNVGKSMRIGIPLSVNVGVSCSNSDGTNYLSLYQKADIALYQSKQAGKDACSFYETSCIETN